MQIKTFIIRIVAVAVFIILIKPIMFERLAFCYKVSVNVWFLMNGSGQNLRLVPGPRSRL